jgi:hypothetical protein
MPCKPPIQTHFDFEPRILVVRAGKHQGSPRAIIPSTVSQSGSVSTRATDKEKQRKGIGGGSDHAALQGDNRSKGKRGREKVRKRLHCSYEMGRSRRSMRRKGVYRCKHAEKREQPVHLYAEERVDVVTARVKIQKPDKSQIFLRTVNLRDTVADGRASANRSRAARSVTTRCTGSAILTFCALKGDEDVIVLSRILNLVQADESPLHSSPAGQPTLLFAHLTLALALFHGQSKLAVDEPEGRLAVLVDLFEYVLRLELEIHGVGVGKVFEEREQLNDVVLFHDLNADRVGGPLLVDRDDHTAAGNGKGRCDAGRVSGRRYPPETSRIQGAE